MIERIQAATAALFAPKKPEPSYPRLPLVRESGESSVPGVFLIGEVGGTPLIKLGLNQGVEIIDRLKRDLDGAAASESDDLYDVVIIGAGSSGLGAAMRAHELGLSYVVLESERVAMTVVNMYKGKILFAEPVDVPNRSSMWFEECTREELLERWDEQIRDTGLNVRVHEKVTDIQRRGDEIEVKSIHARYRARRVVLGVGKAGNPRKAGVPGEKEHPGKVFHHLSDPEEIRDRDVLVYGGGDVAAEAALALSPHNRVTLATIDEDLIFPRKRNRDALLKQQRSGTIDLRMSTRLTGFDADSATLQASGPEETVSNDLVFEMIGAELPLSFFRRARIKLEGDWDVKRWSYLAVISLFVYTLYALKKFPEMPYSWPFHHFMSVEAFGGVVTSIFDLAFAPFEWMFDPAALEQMRGTLWFQQGYLYSLVYTLLMVGFGRIAFKRWSAIARDNRYQKWRFATLATFQVVFFLMVNVVAVQAMSIEYTWRAWGLYQPWPLFFNTFHWWNDSDPRVILYGFIGAGLFGTFVAIPLASRKHGKRFCTWICGCGGLAETLGDRWRHLSPKGNRSRAWEFQGALILVAVAIVTLVTIGSFQTRADNSWAKGYAYLVDFWLVAVIPIALYPFFGGKIWCRYWCPLAAWNQILAAWYGRLKIKANEKCISCTMCSRYCQVGVDVMAFAKNQEPFDNRNSSCIHCGICIDVCPMDVLSFDTAKVETPGKLIRNID